MFNKIWFNKKRYTNSFNVKDKIPKDYITVDKILYVRSIYYDEHCLECSAPACYSTCAKYERRKDGSCVRLKYGIKGLKIKNGLLWDVKIKFKEWGKLEARINKGSLPVKDIRKLDKKDARIAEFFKTASTIRLSKDGIYTRKYDGLRRRKYSRINAISQFVNDFLFQCYYEGQAEFNLILEVADTNNKIVYKNSIAIKKGYNQELIKFGFVPPEGGFVRLYPENNNEAELEIFAADFVQLKNAIPQIPASKIKCLAWDLDGTIWNGILMENDVDSLVLRENVLNVIKQLDMRGIIQIIVSKNDKEKVVPVLKRLNIYDYFVLILSNWGAKSFNIYNASKLLNFNIDTFGFIDDSEFERDEVEKSLSCVRVYKESEIKEILLKEEFNSPITSESKKRRQSYLDDVKRKEVSTHDYLGDNVGFIKNCDIRIIIKAIETEEEKNRSLELIQRTNQLNLSSKKYNKDEFDEILKDASKISLIANVKDRFGDYGQVLYLCYEVGDEVKVTEFAMSCRVAAKYIESAIFDYLRKKHGKDIRALGRRTDRNGTLTDALKKSGFTDCGDNETINMKLNTSAINFDVCKLKEL